MQIEIGKFQKLENYTRSSYIYISYSDANGKFLPENFTSLVDMQQMQLENFPGNFTSLVESLNITARTYSARRREQQHYTNVIPKRRGSRSCRACARAHRFRCLTHVPFSLYVHKFSGLNKSIASTVIYMTYYDQHFNNGIQS